MTCFHCFSLTNFIHNIHQCSSPVHSGFTTAWDLGGPMEDICHSNMVLPCVTEPKRGRSKWQSFYHARKVEPRYLEKVRVSCAKQRKQSRCYDGSATGRRLDHKMETANDSWVVCHLSASCCVQSCQLCGQNHADGETRTYDGTQMGECKSGWRKRVFRRRLCAHRPRNPWCHGDK